MAIKAAASWLGLVALVLQCYSGERAYLEGSEHLAAGFAACVLSASLVHRLVFCLVEMSVFPQFSSLANTVLRGVQGGPQGGAQSQPTAVSPPAGGRKKGALLGPGRRVASRETSGVILAGFVVEGIAASTNWIMFLTKVPVVVDEVTGGRVHLLRWCEWTVLAFLMTYLCETIDARPSDSLTPLLVAASQGFSTACGLVFPAAAKHSGAMWSFFMALSFLTW